MLLLLKPIFYFEITNRKLFEQVFKVNLCKKLFESYNIILLITDCSWKTAPFQIEYCT